MLQCLTPFNYLILMVQFFWTNMSLSYNSYESSRIQITMKVIKTVIRMLKMGVTMGCVLI